MVSSLLNTAFGSIIREILPDEVARPNLVSVGTKSVSVDNLRQEIKPDLSSFVTDSDKLAQVLSIFSTEPNVFSGNLENIGQARNYLEERGFVLSEVPDTDDLGVSIAVRPSDNDVYIVLSPTGIFDNGFIPSIEDIKTYLDPNGPGSS